MNGFLLDNSVIQRYQRQTDPQLVSYVTLRAESSPMCITPIVEGEYKFSARSNDEFRRIDRWCRALENKELTPLIAQEAVSIIDDLAMGTHMFAAVQITDAVVAAVALHYGLEIVHNDTDYGHIARIRPGLLHTRFA